MERRWLFALSLQQMMTARAMIATTKIAEAPVTKLAYCTLTNKNPPAFWRMLLVLDSSRISSAVFSLLSRSSLLYSLSLATSSLGGHMMQQKFLLSFPSSLSNAQTFLDSLQLWNVPHLELDLDSQKLTLLEVLT